MDELDNLELIACKKWLLENVPEAKKYQHLITFSFKNGECKYGITKVPAEVQQLIKTKLQSK